MRRTALAVAAALLVASCGGSSGLAAHAVFAVATGFSNSGPATTIDVTDIGLPLLHNQSSLPVRLQRVSLTTSRRAVHVLYVVAYKYSQIRIGFGVTVGNLLEHCRKSDTPYPVGDVVTPAGSDSDWDIVIGVQISEPGVYHLDRAKITYTTGGHVGWQYQNLNLTIRVSAARPGAKPGLTGC
jgi:hypothetical protein